MTKDETLRRGKPETRSHFDRAKDEFEKAKGDTRVTERRVECPSCDPPNTNMLKRTSYRPPQQVRVELICSVNPEHDDDRYGFYATDGS